VVRLSEKSEALSPDESLHRNRRVALTTQPVGTRGTLSSALTTARTTRLAGPLASSVVWRAPSTWTDDTLFGRVEYVQKSAQDLVIPLVPPTTQYDVAVRRSLPCAPSAPWRGSPPE